MSGKIYNLFVDMKKPTSSEILTVVTDDTNSAIFNITVTDNYVAKDITGMVARLAFNKPDGKQVYQDAQMVNPQTGQITCILSTQTLAVAGRVTAEVKLTDTNSEMTSSTFIFNIRQAILDENTVESSNEFQALTKAMTDIEEAIGSAAQLTALHQDVADTKVLQPSLQGTIDTANATKANLEGTITEANAVNNDLEQNIATANSSGFVTVTQMTTELDKKMDKQIADDTTQKKYIMGINNGLLYYKEVTA